MLHLFKTKHVTLFAYLSFVQFVLCFVKFNILACLYQKSEIRDIYLTRWCRTMQVNNRSCDLSWKLETVSEVHVEPVCHALGSSTCNNPEILCCFLMFSCVFAFKTSLLVLASPSSDQLHQACVRGSVRPGLEKKNSWGDKTKGQVWRRVAPGTALLVYWLLTDQIWTNMSSLEVNLGPIYNKNTPET